MEKGKPLSMRPAQDAVSYSQPTLSRLKQEHECLVRENNNYKKELQKLKMLLVEKEQKSKVAGSSSKLLSEPKAAVTSKVELPISKSPGQPNQEIVKQPSIEVSKSTHSPEIEKKVQPEKKERAPKLQLKKAVAPRPPTRCVNDDMLAMQLQKEEMELQEQLFMFEILEARERHVTNLPPDAQIDPDNMTYEVASL